MSKEGLAHVRQPEKITKREGLQLDARLAVSGTLGFLNTHERLAAHVLSGHPKRQETLHGVMDSYRRGNLPMIGSLREGKHGVHVYVFEQQGLRLLPSPHAVIEAFVPDRHTHHDYSAIRLRMRYTNDGHGSVNFYLFGVLPYHLDNPNTPGISAAIKTALKPHERHNIAVSPVSLYPETDTGDLDSLLSLPEIEALPDEEFWITRKTGRRGDRARHGQDSSERYRFLGRPREEALYLKVT